MNTWVTVAPTSEPITAEEAKAQSRIDVNADDTLLEGFIQAAREEFENRTDKTLFSTTYTLILDRWPNRNYIDLPRAKPLASVTSITYKDEDGNTTAMSTSDYVVDVNAWPGRIVLDSNASWPTPTLWESGAITVTYVAGYSNTADIPQRYKQAIALLAAHWYEHREEVIITGAVPQTIPMGFEAIASTARWETR